jgi:hypothetical protein
MRKILFYFLMLLFLLPAACSGSRHVYDQKRGLMILDDSEQPRNQKALKSSKKRHKKNRKKPKSNRRKIKKYYKNRI